MTIAPELTSRSGGTARVRVSTCDPWTSLNAIRAERILPRCSYYQSCLGDALLPSKPEALCTVFSSVERRRKVDFAPHHDHEK